MKDNYVKNYITAIKNPLPELKYTFEKEFEILKKCTDINSIVLDVGCGAGRPADILSKFVKKIICIDIDIKMISLAKKRCKNIKNVETIQGDALNLIFPDNSFDLVYATYNLIGSLKKVERQKLINEMFRVAKKGGKIINITWKEDNDTTEFLRKYYPSIGIKIIELDNSKTVTSKGTFDRISKLELQGYYNLTKLKNIELIDIGSVWVAIVGTK